MATNLLCIYLCKRKMVAPRVDAKHFMTNSKTDFVTVYSRYSWTRFWKHPWRPQLIRGTVLMLVFNDLKCCFVGLIFLQELIMAPLYLTEHAPFERAALKNAFVNIRFITAGKLGNGDVMVTTRLTPTYMQSRSRTLLLEASCEI